MKFPIRAVVCSVIFWGFTAALTMADDPLNAQLEVFRKARGEAMAKENQIFFRWLESSLIQARLSKNADETARLEMLIEQLRTDTASLLKNGDTKALIPTNGVQLSAFLTGTTWRPENKVDGAREFTADGRFTSKKSAIPFTVVNARRVVLIWAPSTRVDCEFNDDYTAMKELSGERHTWYRAQ